MNHGENAAVPARRRLPHVVCNLTDLCIDFIEHVTEIPGNAADQEVLYPLFYLVDDVLHGLSPRLTEQPGQQGDKIDADQNDASPGHELLDALALC